VTFENKNLVRLKTDDDILQLMALAKAVKRDAYKMSAFLRFREVNLGGNEHFIAWYEPEHFSLELKLDFFQTRFKNMRWSILTPYRAAHWDTETLILEDNPCSSVLPDNDHIEKYWLTYYANIFNPARIKKDAMLSSMPKKYWKNMPETSLIDDMIKQSDTRARKMITDGNKRK
ncbi:TIGR03915 family putative DNA repair protein, partial [Alteromonas mediterranea]|uniref:TIGR03915 family putative DNA repair protein n=1 Tax=Alteromonas mediterranea TaxID=314275 RepID=UPI002FE3F0DA